MSKLFEGIPKREVRPDPDAPLPPLPEGALERGSFWTLFERDGTFTLQFMSGQVAGFEREIVVSREEADHLRATGDAAATAIILSHGGG